MRCNNLTVGVDIRTKAICIRLADITHPNGKLIYTLVGFCHNFNEDGF